MNTLKFIKEKLAHYTWDLAYGEFSDKIISSGLNGVKYNVIKNPYKNKWFADPFILKEDILELHLLVEEFDSDIQRGRIAHLIINKEKNIITDCKVILDLPTHLSFPVIYRVGDTIYVHPENSKSGKSYIYKYDTDEDRLIEPICICNEPIADAIIININNLYYMYATKDPTPNGNTLIKYMSNNFYGPYKQIEQKIYSSDIARMAGSFIKMADKIIRPAQDCNGAYGRAVLFMLGNKVLSELSPTKIKYAGLHTFNTLGNTFVIDLKKYDHPILFYIKNKLK